MDSASYSVRRATIDDLPSLIALWQSMKLPVSDLEKQLTEFQVAVDEGNQIVGAVGFGIAGKNGLIHSEGFTDFGLADIVRPMFWERLKMVAANHGTVHAWTKESTQFWKQAGLESPSQETLAKLPPVWSAFPGGWLVIKLREDVEEVLSADKEFEMFRQASKRETEATLGQARVLKTVALVGALVLGLAVLIASVFLMLHRQPVSPP